MPIQSTGRVGLRSGTIVELFEPEPVLHLLAAINAAILVGASTLFLTPTSSNHSLLFIIGRSHLIRWADTYPHRSILWRLTSIGIHCILFCVCAYIFLSRRLVKPFIIGSAIIMFALSTADVAISLGLLVGGLRSPFEDETHLITCRYPKNPIFVANK